MTSDLKKDENLRFDLAGSTFEKKSRIKYKKNFTTALAAWPSGIVCACRGMGREIESLPLHKTVACRKNSTFECALKS
jgi:hypothetical protein